MSWLADYEGVPPEERIYPGRASSRTGRVVVVTCSAFVSYMITLADRAGVDLGASSGKSPT
jgi:hypothetical protein